MKGFDKICAKCHSDSGEHLASCQQLVVPQLLAMAYEVAERDKSGQKRKRQTTAPATPTLPDDIGKKPGEKESDKPAKKSPRWRTKTGAKSRRRSPRRSPRGRRRLPEAISD